MIKTRYLRTASAIFVYLGLTLAGLAIPALMFVLWIGSLLDMASPNYGYLFLAWLVSMVMLLLGVVLRKV